MKTESKFLKHIPCMNCGSSDGNSLYDDGHEFCHVCHTYKRGSEAMVQAVMREGITTPEKLSPKPFNTVLEALASVEAVQVAERGITVGTMHFFGAGSDGNTYYFPYCDNTGKVVAARD